MMAFGVLGAATWGKVEAFGQRFLVSSIHVLMMDKAFLLR